MERTFITNSTKLEFKEIIMKAIILNASPRKNWNTAQLLKSAMDGAKAAGAEVEYIDLYDLNFTGCRSCLLCKKKMQKDAVVIGKMIFHLLLIKCMLQIHFLLEHRYI